MTKKSKREIEKELEQLRETSIGAIEVQSDVVTITEDMTDEQGNVTEAIDTPDGEILPTSSDAVTVWTANMD